MADILIRGMDKPGSCCECDFCEVQDINFEILYFCNRNDRFLDDEEACNIPNDCPIIELPENGKLIDVSKISLQEYEQAAHDALHNGKGSILYDCGVLAGARAITQFVRRQPVIVPASKEETE